MKDLSVYKFEYQIPINAPYCCNSKITPIIERSLISMINLPGIMKVVAPIAGALITNAITDNISPKRQENIYEEIVPRTISTVANALIENNNQQAPIERPPIIVEPINTATTPYEIARNKTYRYNF